MKTLLLSVLIAGGLTFAVAEDGIAPNPSHQFMEASSPRQSLNVNGDTTDAGGGRVVVDVWAPASTVNEDQETASKLSQRFARTALGAAAVLQSTERRIEQSIKMGFPLGGNWIQSDFDTIDNSLNAAEQSVTNAADQQALRQLQEQRERLKVWTDWLIDQNRHLRLADYYITPATLNNDEAFQNAVACTRFLSSMLARMKLADDRSCW